MAKTVLMQAFDQLKMQIGEDKFSGMFDEAFWLEREREQIEEAYECGNADGSEETMGSIRKYGIGNYHNSKYGGNND